MTVPKMRIAMIGLRGIPHTYGGGEDLVRYLAPGLARKGHDVIVYCRSNLFKHDRAPYYEGVRRIFLPTFEHKFLGQFIHATLAAFDVSFRKVDIVYIHTLPSGVHSLIPWIAGKTIVVNPNGFDWERAKWGSVGKLFFKLSARVCLFTAKEFITDAKAIQKYYLEQFGRDSSFVAYAASIEQSTKPELLESVGVTPFDYYLIACRLVPENNIDLIIEAFLASNSRRTLLVAGSANYTDNWTRDLFALQDPRLRFLGHISDRELLKELHCNAYAYFHGHSMGGTNPALVKALGYGNCILALDTVFNHEVLISETGTEYGLLFQKDMADIIRLINRVEAEPLLVEALRQQAPNRIQEAYSVQHIVDGYEQAFAKALAVS